MLNNFFNNIKNISIEKLFNVVSENLNEDGYNKFCCTNQHFNGLYRARKHNNKYGVLKNDILQLFKNDIEFWNPPERIITEYGRCNDIHESLFYCSNDFKTAIAEVRPETDDYITVSCFLPIKKCNFSINPIGIKRLKELEIKAVENFSLENEKSAIKKIDNCLEKLFLLNVADNENEKYKLSVAVSKCLLKDLTDLKRIYSMDAIMYPSLVSKFNNSINLAFKPLSIIENYFVASIQTLKVLEKKDEKITLILVRQALTNGQKFHRIYWEEVTNGENYTYPSF